MVRVRPGREGQELCWQHTAAQSITDPSRGVSSLHLRPTCAHSTVFSLSVSLSISVSVSVNFCLSVSVSFCLSPSLSLSLPLSL